MSPAEMELARDLVAHAQWRWASGMRYPTITGGSGGTTWSLSQGRVRDDGRAPMQGAVPDLSDPATWGAILAQLPPVMVIDTALDEVTIAAFTGAGNVTTRGSTWGEAVGRAWLATRAA